MKTVGHMTNSEMFCSYIYGDKVVTGTLNFHGTKAQWTWGLNKTIFGTINTIREYTKEALHAARTSAEISLKS